ncbi:MAG TPA: formate dehydrogenase accessory sulfurtransferase FdhD [Clostridium sp.]|uniref:Sulfur carrier protein FdhD n=1 Tax=Clostridium lapidicellarium TaxID=3240931 RepID=A0ABV4DYX4_9CLOT|nr:formate dehydrogenase accessory sulfurtransferase FdhD [uncultured Clostridium sp.]NLU07323.1 formate dehydrogenase accessory sulfurtransferase FdhD [Clostridiales bacterium]HBC98096.1 formate dehydrogenase accessory sulfurtransferase FdhD [Clostridium sp.]
MDKTLKLKVIKYDGKYEKTMDEMAVREYPLNIFVNGKHLTTLLCTPEKLEELTVGFLAFQGIIKSYDEIKCVKIHEENGTAEVFLNCEGLDISKYLKQVIPHSFSEKKSSEFFSYIINSLKIDKVQNENVHIEKERIYDLMKENLSYSEAFKNTGGVHCAALCNKYGIVSICEDVARHNAVDKLLGESFMKKIPLWDKILFVSSRVSFEMLFKIARFGIPIMISKSAPTDLSIKFAEALNVTLVGFVRGKRMNVYANPQRIV